MRNFGMSVQSEKGAEHWVPTSFEVQENSKVRFHIFINPCCNVLGKCEYIGYIIVVSWNDNSDKWVIFLKTLNPDCPSKIDISARMRSIFTVSVYRYVWSRRLFTFSNASKSVQWQIDENVLNIDVWQARPTWSINLWQLTNEVCGKRVCILTNRSAIWIFLPWKIEKKE